MRTKRSAAEPEGAMLMLPILRVSWWSKVVERGSKRSTTERYSTTQGNGVYAELHCHSNFSFLDGASHPEELAEEAARLGLGRARDHRPRRLLRDRALRGGGACARVADRVRYGADPRRARGAERYGRSARRAPDRALEGNGWVRPARTGDQPGPAGGGEGRAPFLVAATRRRGPGAGARPRSQCRQRHVVRAHRVPQRHGPGRVDA